MKIHFHKILHLLRKRKHNKIKKYERKWKFKKSFVYKSPQEKKERKKNPFPLYLTQAILTRYKNTKSKASQKYIYLFIYFFNLRECPSQLTCTTINPTAHWISYKPSKHVRHRGDDRRTQWCTVRFEPRCRGKEQTPSTTRARPQVFFLSNYLDLFFLLVS